MSKHSKRSTLVLNKFDFTLLNSIEELGISMNYLSVHSEVRPATIAALCNGTAKKLDLTTLHIILDTLNSIAKQKRIDKIYTINNVIQYTPRT